MAEELKKKKKRGIQISDKNDLVKSVVENDYIKNPLLYAQIAGDFTIMQGKVMLSIIKQLQPQIDQVLGGEHKGESLFPAELVENGNLTFELNLADLGVKSNHYDKLEEQAEDLMTLHTSYKENGDYTVMNLFHKIHIQSAPEETIGEDGQLVVRNRRTGRMIIKMNVESAEKVLSLAKGYTEHLQGIYDICNSPRSARLYIYLSSWRQQGFYKASYLDLKEYLGILEFDKSRKKVEMDKYPKYGVFSRDVLRAAKKELDKLAEMGQIDFSFDFSPIYPGSAKRGTPSHIMFTINDSKLGEDLVATKKIGKVGKELIKRYHLNEVQWKEIDENIHITMVGDLYDELSRIDNLIERYQPDDVAAYATRMIMKWIKEKSLQLVMDFDQAVEIKEGEEEKKLPTVEQMKQWNNMMLLLSETVAAKDFETFFTIWKLTYFEDNVIYTSVPNGFCVEQMEGKFKELILNAKNEIFGEDYSIVYVPDVKPFN